MYVSFWFDVRCVTLRVTHILFRWCELSYVSFCWQLTSDDNNWQTIFSQSEKKSFIRQEIRPATNVNNWSTYFIYFTVCMKLSEIRHFSWLKWNTKFTSWWHTSSFRHPKSDKRKHPKSDKRKQTHWLLFVFLP